MSAVTPTIVARDRSRYGGECRRCGRRIKRHGVIVKVDVGARGPQTSGGNGQGEWWCEWCAANNATD